MGVYVEEEWRYKKKGSDAQKRSLRASNSAFTYKVNKRRKSRDKKSYLRSREVFVKFTKGAKSRAGIREAIKYISREYELELYDSEGVTHKSKGAIEDTT